MIAKTPQEKRELAEYLKKHDPQFLEFVKAASQTFGILKEVSYEPRRNRS